MRPRLFEGPASASSGTGDDEGEKTEVFIPGGEDEGTNSVLEAMDPRLALVLPGVLSEPETAPAGPDEDDCFLNLESTEPPVGGGVIARFRRFMATGAGEPAGDVPSSSPFSSGSAGGRLF
jgi:hypothetical protein